MKNKIIEKVKETRFIANSPIDSKIPHASQEILKGRKRNAKDMMKTLQDEHRVFVRKNCVLMIMCGELSDKIAELGRTKFNCFKLDIDKFFLFLTEKVPTSHYMGKGIGSGAFDFLIAELENIANEVGISSYNMIMYKASYNKIISSREELAEVFKTAFMEQVGGEFLAAVASHKAATIAFDKEQDRLSYPVILYTKDFDLAPKLKKDFKNIFNRSFLISCDREKLVDEADGFITRVNKLDLKSTFNKIKDLYS